MKDDEYTMLSYIFYFSLLYFYSTSPPSYKTLSETNLVLVVLEKKIGPQALGHWCFPNFHTSLEGPFSIHSGDYTEY